jgi:hypothetical protein
VSQQGGRTYRGAPGVVWAKDAEQAILVEEQSGRSWSLGGVEAAIWDWLAEGYPSERIACFLALATGFPEAEAWRTLAMILRGWEEAGILVGEGNGCDQPGD